MFAFIAVLFLPLSLYCATGLAQTLCNGHAELCGRKYSNITTIGAHDSAFVGKLPQDNQEVSVTAQLDAGIRFLQAQTHKNIFGELQLCHTSCFEEDAGDLGDYLSTIKSWLDANPNEVLTLLLVNGDNVPVSMFDAAYSSSGLKSHAYIPPTSSTLALDAWPTLQQLITAGTRLVAFLDAGANVATVPYILDEFAYFFETPFDTLDPTFPECTLDRPAGAKADGRMYIVNHFLDLEFLGIDVPDREALNKTNAATGVGSIGAQVDLCIGLYGRAPVGVLVDFFNHGDVFTAQDGLNGL